MDRLKHLLPFLLLGTLAVPVITSFAPDASMLGGLRLSVTPEHIRESSLSVLKEQGVDHDGMTGEVRVRSNRDLVRQVQARFGVRDGNAIMRSWPGGYRWVARWSKDRGVTFSTDEGDTERQSRRARSWLQGDVRVEYDMDGTLIGYYRDVPDSLSLPSAGQDSVRLLVRAFIRTHGGSGIRLGGTDLASVVSDSPATPRPQELFRRTDHILEWPLRDTVTGDAVTVRARVSGSFVSELDVSFEVPPAYTESSGRTISSIIEAVAFVALFITIVIVSFRRFRAYEIGFRLATVIGIATGIGLGVKLYTILAPTGGWEMVFPLVLGPLFYGGGALLVWAAAESMVRETWKEKAVALDLLSMGHITHSRIGQSIVRGVSLGLAMHALSLLMNTALGQLTNVTLVMSENSVYDFVASEFPFFAVLMESFYTQVYTVAFFLMFLGSWLFKRTGNRLVSAGAIVAVLTGMRAFMYEPAWAGLLLVAVPFVVAAFAFIRYDILTAFLALMVSVMTEYGAVLYGSTNPFFTDSALYLGGFLVLLTVTGLLSQFRTDDMIDPEAIAPAYSRHITERERLRHELEIARSVQMSFLPKANPTVRSLDIASRCAPALEVGGDYYDFIELPEGRLAVAVGDVSGKGTQAAFFMTLTKGFLRALARVTGSPGKTLAEVNRLFYENVERGVFISLIYGIFDTAASRLTIARAGHNPVILRKSSQRDTQVLDPMGLALGLDKGDVFERSVKEVSVAYEPGDTFVFYTDGISEAMNRTREEYGEERLAASISKHAHKNAAGLLDGILQDMHIFVGKAEQHDDVTLVVVKII